MVAMGRISQIGGLAVLLGIGIALSSGVAAADSTGDPAPARGDRVASPSARAHVQHTASERTAVTASDIARHGASARRRVRIATRVSSAPDANAHAKSTDPFGGGIASLLFNQSPIVGAAHPVQGPNGVVTGQIQASDVDSADLAFTITGKPSHGEVSIGPDGSFTYIADSAVSTTGTTDSFSVTVNDAGSGFHIHGLIGLINMLTFGLAGESGHMATSRVSLTIDAFADPPGGLSTFCGCTLMPADTVFHADVSTLEVLPQSDTWVTLLGGNLRAAWGGTPWMGTTAGMPVNTASATQAGETVVFNRGLTSSGPTIDDRAYAIPDYPLVEGMPDAPAWDRHLLVLQQGTCRSQELYNVANGVELPANGVADALANAIYASQYGSTWLAEAGVQYDMNSASYPVKGEANASQLPFLPLILRPDDLARGSIDHMLGIVIAKDRGTGYSWPARSGDGTGTNPNGVPMGTVFRLPAGFDVSAYDSATQVVLRALQEHGAVVYDSWNPGQDGAGLLAMSNGWSGADYLTAQRELSTIPLSAFEAVDVLSLALDPASGWTIRT